MLSAERVNTSRPRITSRPEDLAIPTTEAEEPKTTTNKIWPSAEACVKFLTSRSPIEKRPKIEVKKEYYSRGPEDYL